MLLKILQPKIHENELQGFTNQNLNMQKIFKTAKYLQVDKYLCSRGSFQSRSSFYQNCTIPTSVISCHSLKHLFGFIIPQCSWQSTLHLAKHIHKVFFFFKHSFWSIALRPRGKQWLTSVLKKLMTEWLSTAAAAWGLSWFTSAFAGCSAVRLLPLAKSCRRSLRLRSSIS